MAVVLLLVGAVAYEVWRIPVQVSDSLGNLLQVQQQPLGTVFVSQFSNGAFVRPLLWAQFKVAYTAAHGHEPLMFKAIHVAQLLLLAVLFLRPLQVRTRGDLAAALLASLVLVGIHTFDGLVREAFPINSFLTITLCVLAALNVSIGPPAWWRDLAAIGLFGGAVLTIESGVLVLATVAAARIAGLKGVSWRGVTWTALACGGYLVLRLALGVGSPGLGERASGFGFQILEPQQLIERFGSHPMPFRAYNVLSSLVSVLLAEPRGGVWWAVHGLVNGDVLPPWLSINIVASAAVTGLVLIAAVGSLRRWLTGTAGSHDQILLVCLTVLVANAVVSFGYTKDVIMSAGGACFALAVYASAAVLLGNTQGRSHRLTAAVVGLSLVLWTVRAVALPYRLERQVAVVQAEWMDVYPWLERQHIAVTSPQARALVERLRRDALRVRPRPVEWSGWRGILDLN